MSCVLVFQLKPGSLEVKERYSDLYSGRMSRKTHLHWKRF